MSEEETRRPEPQERLSSLGRVMGELVHDLNNEVTVLQGWAMLARGELEAGRLPNTEVERVVGITDVLAQMLRDMLDTVAGRGVSPEVGFDPVEVAERTISDRLRGMASATVRLSSTLPDGVRVAGRASFWVRALANLLGNATRHARGAIAVTLELGEVEGGEPVVVMRVEDDGAGIPPERRASVFEPFEHGGEGGTGLGLSSVAWAVAQLRGTVGYRDDSTLGGAAFEILVPVASRLVAARPADRGSGVGAEAMQGARVMVVDDDRPVRHAIQRLLQRSGVDVRELDPRGEPESHILQAILSVLPDVVLLDLRLGDRGGLALWNRMCLDMPHLATRVIFVSGAAPGEPDWEQAQLTGQPLLGKPFDMRELADTVTRLRAEQ